MGKKAKEHRKKVAKRNARVQQQKTGMQKAFEKLIEEKVETFEAEIKDQITAFTNEKLEIVKDAKKELEKQAQFFSLIFTGVSIAITLAFLGLIFSYVTSRSDGLENKLQAQFEAQKTVVEMQLKQYEAKASQPLPSPKKP